MESTRDRDMVGNGKKKTKIDSNEFWSSENEIFSVGSKTAAGGGWKGEWGPG